jgi:hypothetical protein
MKSTMPAGRPKLYEPNEFEEAVRDYFQNLDEGEIPNKAGLLLSIGLSRETWREYKQREEFVDTIRDAEATIEDAWVQRLNGSGATGPIFYLKNAFKENYRDSHDVTSDGKALPTPILNGISTHTSDTEDSETEK